MLVFTCMLMISDLLLPARLGRMLREAAPADRWAAKILAYPCFDDGFRQAILATRLVELPFRVGESNQRTLLLKDLASRGGKTPTMCRHKLTA